MGKRVKIKTEEKFFLFTIFVLKYLMLHCLLLSAGKFCPACGKQIFHEKWKVSPELQEARWAHKQARQRELAEVVDFLE